MNCGEDIEMYMQQRPCTEVIVIEGFAYLIKLLGNDADMLTFEQKEMIGSVIARNIRSMYVKICGVKRGF